MTNPYNNWNSREWMYQRMDEETNNIVAEYYAGVAEFMNLANS